MSAAAFEHAVPWTEEEIDRATLGYATDVDEIRVVRGAPADEELAALVTVLLAVGSGSPTARNAAAISRWARSARLPAILRGTGSWRAAALPR